MVDQVIVDPRSMPSELGHAYVMFSRVSRAEDVVSSATVLQPYMREEGQSTSTSAKRMRPQPEETSCYCGAESPGPFPKPSIPIDMSITTSRRTLNGHLAIRPMWRPCSCDPKIKRMRAERDRNQSKSSAAASDIKDAVVLVETQSRGIL